MNRAALYSTGVICAFRSHCPPVPDGVTAEARGTTRIMKLPLPLSLGDISLSRLVVVVVVAVIISRFPSIMNRKSTRDCAKKNCREFVSRRPEEVSGSAVTSRRGTGSSSVEFLRSWTQAIPAARLDRDLSSTGNKLDRGNLVLVSGVTMWNAVDLKLLPRPSVLLVWCKGNRG